MACSTPPTRPLLPIVLPHSHWSLSNQLTRRAEGKKTNKRGRWWFDAAGADGGSFESDDARSEILTSRNCTFPPRPRSRSPPQNRCTIGLYPLSIRTNIHRSSSIHIICRNRRAPQLNCRVLLSKLENLAYLYQEVGRGGHQLTYDWLALQTSGEATYTWRVDCASEKWRRRWTTSIVLPPHFLPPLAVLLLIMPSHSVLFDCLNVRKLC